MNALSLLDITMLNIVIFMEVESANVEEQRIRQASGQYDDMMISSYWPAVTVGLPIFIFRPPSDLSTDRPLRLVQPSLASRVNTAVSFF